MNEKRDIEAAVRYLAEAKALDEAYRARMRTWVGEQVAKGGTTIEAGERIERAATDPLVDEVAREMAFHAQLAQERAERMDRDADRDDFAREAAFGRGDEDYCFADHESDEEAAQ